MCKIAGIGSTIGAGVYVLVGTVARERAGPALTLSFLIAGIAAALAALCYAELSSRLPSAGSAYHYAYTCVGEGYVTANTSCYFFCCLFSVLFDANAQLLASASLIIKGNPHPSQFLFQAGVG
jgi:amino acid transporter